MKRNFRKAISSCLALLLILIVMASPISVNAASVKISKKSIALYVGQSKTLKLKNLKKKYKNKVKWKSSNKKVATVSKKGKVVAKKQGKATITAKVNNKKYKCKVFVTIPTFYPNQKTTITKVNQTTYKKTIKTTTKNKTNSQKHETTTNNIHPLISRTTNKAGAASNKFIKSLKGFTLKILYPWENIYGTKKCQVAAEDSIKSVEELYGVKIDEEGQFNRYNENLASELAARNCDNHIYFAQGGFFPSYFQKGHIADLAPAMRETGVDFNEPWYVSSAKGFLNIDGKQYGWMAAEDEHTTTPYMLIYNKRLLSKKRLQDPSKLAEQGRWTWDVLEKYAKKFANDKSVVGFGTVDNLALFETIALNYGASLTKVSRGSQPTTNITDSKVTAALTEYASWTVGKNAWCDTFYGKSWSYGKTIFSDGKVAMIFGGHDCIQALSGTSTKNDVDVVPFPTKKGTKTYTNVVTPAFVAFIPSVRQSVTSKALFVRNEYYRYNYRFIERNFQYKLETFFYNNTDALTHSAEIKFSKNGNKTKFSWTTLCESNDYDSTTTSSIIYDVISSKSTAAQAIASKKNALIESYADVWEGHKITGNV